MVREEVIAAMREVFREIPYGIKHTLKVLGYAEAIMEGEKVEEADRELIALVAILHDIGVVEAQAKYSSFAAPYQEMEGPPVARRILLAAGYDQVKTERVCYIVGNHHTPARIDGVDFAIQWDADLVENLASMEVRKEPVKLREFIEANFRTATGKRLAYERYGQGEASV